MSGTKCSECPAAKKSLLRTKNGIQPPEFKSYEEEAMFWDNLDTADMMEDDGKWFHFDGVDARAGEIDRGDIDKSPR